MAKTVRSKKNKGKRLQNEVRDLILEQFSQLEQDDVVSTGMGQPGVDVQLSPLARKLFPYSIECKNQEKLSVWAAIKQALNNKKDGTNIALFFTKNYEKNYVILEADHFVEMVAKLNLLDNKE